MSVSNISFRVGIPLDLCGLPCVVYGETLRLVHEFLQRVLDPTPEM